VMVVEMQIKYDDEGQGSYSSWNKKFNDFAKTFKDRNYDFSSTKIDGMQYVECAGCVNLSSK